MRFCPFCAQENSDDASDCAHCGRRLPAVAAMPSAAPTTRATLAVAPRRLPRAFPRTRPVTPAPALTKPIVQEAVPTPVPEVGTRARSGTLLGIPVAAPVAAQMEEPLTRVDGSPFESETTQTSRLTAEELTAVGETTSPSERYDDQLEDPGEPTRVGKAPHAPEPSGPGDQEFGPEVTSTSVQMRAPQHVPPVAAPSLVTDRKAPPVPLPPPPAAPRAIRLDPPPVVTAEVDLPALPDSGPLDLSSRHIVENVPAERAPAPSIVVVPMPAQPQPTILASVKYLVPLAKAIYARHKAQAQLRGLLHDDQRRVDQALRDLGEAAWHLQPRPAELRPDLDRADLDEGKRRDCENELARLEMSVTEERQRFAADEQKRQAEIARHEAEVARLVEDVAERRRAQKTEEKALREIELRLRTAERTMQQHLARATKADATPTEKGGGPHAAANAREQAEVVRREVDAYQPQVEEQEGKVRALDAPIAELELHLADARQQVSTQKADLESARRASQQALAGLELERDQQETTRLAAERSVRLRLVATGTLLSLHRMGDAEHGGQFTPIYERLDQLQTIASARDARISELDAERHGYDRQAVQRGLITVGGAVGLLAILLLVLLVVVKH